MNTDQPQPQTEQEIHIDAILETTPEVREMIKELYEWIQEVMYAEEMIQPTEKQLQSAFDFVYHAFNNMGPKGVVDPITDD